MLWNQFFSKRGKHLRAGGQGRRKPWGRLSRELQARFSSQDERATTSVEEQRRSNLGRKSQECSDAPLSTTTRAKKNQAPFISRLKPIHDAKGGKSFQLLPRCAPHLLSTQTLWFQGRWLGMQQQTSTGTLAYQIHHINTVVLFRSGAPFVTL